MRVFTEEEGSFSEKVNYVDENDRFVGYDMMRNCCESFGHCIATTPEAETYDGPVKRVKTEDVDLSPYRFVDEPPTKVEPEDEYDRGGTLFFRIAAEGLPDLFVAIWNYHNGYYAHGFESFKTEGNL
jgi:hypothetical protein